MNVKFCLAFPCEAVSVPVMRRVLGDTLRNLGVTDDCIGDLLVAVTEACTNVLRHAGPTRRYEVVTSVGRGGCVVEVVDSGLGMGRTGAVGRAVVGAGARGAGARGESRRAANRVEETRPGRATDPKDLAYAADSARRAERRAQRRALLSGGRAHIPMPPARRPEDQAIARLPESGRGLQIMRALVDDVTLRSGPGRGTVVSMRKRVAWRRDAPLVGLSDHELRDAG